MISWKNKKLEKNFWNTKKNFFFSYFLKMRVFNKKQIFSLQDPKKYKRKKYVKAWKNFKNIQKKNFWK